MMFMYDGMRGLVLVEGIGVPSLGIDRECICPVLLLTPLLYHHYMESLREPWVEWSCESRMLFSGSSLIDRIKYFVKVMKSGVSCS